MDKTLQTTAWNCLPREFKEEVKKDYQYAVKNRNRSVLQRGASDTLEYFFGIHNLTSDAEGEEMLIVSRKEVQEAYKERACASACYNKWEEEYLKYNSEMALLKSLFGSKCLPDEACNVASSDVASNVASSKPKPAEPKFEMGDLVTINDSPRGYVINGISYDDCYGEYLYGLTVYDAFKESELKLVPHSRLHMGDKVRVKENNRIGTIIEPHSDDVGYRVFFDDGDGGEDAEYSEEELELYKELTKPKHKVGDKVVFENVVCTITQVCYKDSTYSLMKDKTGAFVAWIAESDLEPYTEPEASTCTYDCLSQCLSKTSQNIIDCDKQLEAILKDGFRNERRCNIAVQMIKAFTQSPEIVDRISSGCDDGLLDGILHDALYLTDKLIAECEKGSRDGED